jgi:hypothetical protein
VRASIGEGRARARGSGRRIEELARTRRRVIPWAALGARQARAEGRLHGDHPPRVRRRCATARSAATTAPIAARTGGRRVTASSSCRASTSRGRGRGS